MPRDLTEWAEEFSDILGEKSGLLQRGKVAAPGHKSPALDVVPALCERAGGDWNLHGEDRHCHWRLDAVSRAKLQRLFAGFIIQAY